MGSMRDLSNVSETKMSYSDFKKEAKYFDDKALNLSIKEIEDEYWNHIFNSKETPGYAIDNNFSLFPSNVQHWNLGKFQYKQSIIHEVINETLHQKIFDICFWLYNFSREKKSFFI